MKFSYSHLHVEKFIEIYNYSWGVQEQEGDNDANK